MKKKDRRIKELELQVEALTSRLDNQGVIVLPKCNRVEVIDTSGRSYTNYDCNVVNLSMQDDDRTLKVFIY